MDSLGVDELSLARRLKRVDQGGALDMSHAEEVAGLGMRQHSIQSLIATDHILLEVEFAGVWRHIAACDVYRLGVGTTRTQLRSLTYRDVVALVGDEVLGHAIAMDSHLPCKCQNILCEGIHSSRIRGCHCENWDGFTSLTTKAPLFFTWNCSKAAMARLKLVDQTGSSSLKMRCDTRPSGLNTILKGLYVGYMSLVCENFSPELFNVTSSTVN